MEAEAIHPLKAKGREKHRREGSSRKTLRTDTERQAPRQGVKQEGLYREPECHHRNTSAYVLKAPLLAQLRCVEERGVSRIPVPGQVGGRARIHVSSRDCALSVGTETPMPTSSRSEQSLSRLFEARAWDQRRGGGVGLPVGSEGHELRGVD